MAVIQEASRPSDLVLYTFLRDSFNAKLDEYHLLYSYDLPLTTLVTDLIHQVVNDLQGSSFAYQFSGNTQGSFLPHETLPLQLLELVNRGTRRQGVDIVRLRRAPLRAGWTLQDLARDRTHFAAANISIEGNRLVLNFGK